ncbi:MAG: isoamylase early set domain-containing protein [Chloroflexota bacterium]|jgi:hypothetical protein|nr:isoamylase early set domain-containing protein [Chloroflexota bacterium]
MIRKLSSPVPGCVRVVFELPSGVWADRISIAGDFNNWSESATPLRQDRDGVWRAMLDLPAGTSWQFRYLIDGEWSADYHADGGTASALGAPKSIVHAQLPPSVAVAEPAAARPSRRPLAPLNRTAKRPGLRPAA